MTSLGSEDGGEASFLKQFSPGKWPDDKSMRLYSCNVSPSSCLSFGVGDCLSSLQSISENSELLSDKAVTLFDGSRVNPIEEALMVLHENQSESEAILQEDLKGDEIVTWLITSNGVDFSDSSTCSDISDSFLSMSLEDFSTSDDSSCQFSIELDSPCLPQDTDRTGFSLPLINLDGEDSNWFSDAQSELDLIYSDFPSPSFKKSWGFEIHSSGSSVSAAINMRYPKSKCITTCFDEASEAFDLAEYSPDTPLFWPLSEKLDWSSDVTLDFLVLSPRKKNFFLSSTCSSDRSFRFRIHQGRKKEMGNNFRRRLVFGSGSKSSNILEFNCRNGKRKVRRSSTMPLKFSNSKRCQAKAPLQSKADTVDYCLLKKSVELSKKNFTSSLEDTIETIMGLNEFNGHEGIELEFDKDVFSLDEDL